MTNTNTKNSKSSGPWWVPLNFSVEPYVLFAFHMYTDCTNPSTRISIYIFYISNRAYSEATEVFKEGESLQSTPGVKENHVQKVILNGERTPTIYIFIRYKCRNVCVYTKDCFSQRTVIS